ncbi:Ribonucleoprotein LSM domain eukaryotic/archaea-type [Penicillium riverlandense]|uniref:Ribonucleoprotein LSM domain eukaryotic/archaea-type n=1 Tax=Penicillium riverlandense TaxID=1903569 RepID=UPI002546E54D|nr:Ribonucleoprotein LSM domain eukaryotic/archaea-type [Penicillium riverlandense]KAJ5812624.1 Ribonucleoprotein LSM domain eukaryotic/archaea-type [Penicillium riverlandense]
MAGRKTLLAPIHFIFSLLQKRSTVSIWLYEQLAFRIEGKIRGFDEFMNLVIDDAVEVRLPTKSEEEKRRPLGRSMSLLAPGIAANASAQTGQILLKGDNVSLIQAV